MPLKPRQEYGVAVLVLALCALVPQLSGQSLLPLTRDRTLLVHFDTAPGTSLTEMERVTGSAMRDVRAVPGVRQVTATIGRAVTGDLTVNVNSGQLWVNLTDSADFDTEVAAVRHVLQSYPGVRSQVTTYLQDRLNSAQSGSNTALTGTESAIVVRVYGNDLSVLRAKASQVRQRISQVEGVVDATVQALA